jgi:predicted anti-sigma-YlaC factor YlaD
MVMGDVRPIECERMRHSLSVSLDCELTQLEQARVASHLDHCAQCRSFHERIADVTEAVRSAPLERLRLAIELPAARGASWCSAGRLASVGAVAAVVAVAFLGFATAPDRTSWSGDGALIASALDRPAETNDLLIDMLRPALTSRQQQAIAFGSGGIGAYKPPLAPGL